MRQMGTIDVAQQHLCINFLENEHLELKTGLINLLPTFHGISSEDPHKFLKDFHLACMARNPRVRDDEMKLRAFPFALKDLAREWLYSLPPGSINTWDEIATLFLQKYFPESKASLFRKEIMGAKQEAKENFYNYWERFKKLCVRCPQHGFSEFQILTHFIEGLQPMDKRLLSASCGGSFLDKTPAEITGLITSIAEDMKHSGDDDGEWYQDTPRNVSQAGTSNSVMEARIEELTRAVLQLTAGKNNIIEPP